MPQLSRRAATSPLRRKPAVNRARRENPTHSLEHIPPQSKRASTKNTPTECAPLGAIFHGARGCLRAFYGVRASLRDGSKKLCRSVILTGTGGLKAAFFGYFLCGGKESNCRPAQGQRLRREGATRMPAKKKTRMPAKAKN